VFVARDLKDAFDDRLYAMITRHRRAEDIAAERRVRERALRFGIPTVAAVEVLYHTRTRRDIQDVLTCLRHGVTLSTAGRLTKDNAEHALRSPYAFSLLYEDDPGAVARTEEVAGRCLFSLAEIRYRYPLEKLPDGESAFEHLKYLTLEGAKERYPRERFPAGVPAETSAQLSKELAIIRDLEYEGYFLTMHEIVQYCRMHHILCQGRGSAANSAVCYCLGITAVDPVRMDLLFERFISKERAEPPDIDLDIEH
jgi:error-prone DNA polymerase